ncbi:MAG: SRPBCC family protein [Gemmataceae bacterium]
MTMSLVGPGSMARPSAAASATNVGDVERLASLIGGGALAVYGLARRDLIGVAVAAAGGLLLQRGVSGHCALYQALGVNTAGKPGPATSVPAGVGYKLEYSINVNAPASKLYAFWRNVENLPRIMRHLKEVRAVDGKRSHWVARGPLGAGVSWEAEIHQERPNEMIAWRSLEGSQVDTAGSVHFKPARLNAGASEVRVVLKYDPPGGKLGAALASLFGSDPEQEIREDMARFKEMMETSEPSERTKGRG